MYYLRTCGFTNGVDFYFKIILMIKKNICFVVSAPMTAKAFLLNHIEILSIQYNVYLVANFENADKSMFDYTSLAGVKNIKMHREINPIFDLMALYALRKYFKQMEFDAVHTVTPKAGLLGIFASKLAGVSKRIHIFTGQVWHTKQGIFKKLLMALDRFIVWNATHILVDGESQRKFLIQNKIVKEASSFVLGKGSISGVDTNRFVPDTKIRNEIREELGILNNEVVFMFLGRMNTDKGIDQLAEAFNKISLNYDNVRLLLVGGDEENKTAMINEKVTKLQKVIFYGVTPVPERLLQACDVFCLPSYREGFGTSIIEASLLEKPVICSDTYGLMETIIDNQTGLRHKVGSAKEVQEKMEQLVLDATLRSSLGQAGRTYVLENFSAQTISEKWLEFYKKNV